MDTKAAWPGWETVQLLGKGSFGAVYEIRREVFGHKETAALKVVTIPQSESDIDELLSDGYDRESIATRYEGYLQDIVREYSLMADMKGCANIVYCDDVKYARHENGIGWDIFIKMERLTALPKAVGQSVSDEQVIKIGSDICSALAYCENRSILHRDIKPQNIFAAPDGTCKLGDFGIAKAAERTTSGTKTGTYKYMAPEVYHNQPYGSKADLYSLGLTLYWLLNDRRTPFLPLPPAVPTSAEEDRARARRFAGEPIPAPAHGSEALQRIVLKACAYDPADRYQSAGEMLRALEVLSESGDPAQEEENDDLNSADLGGDATEPVIRHSKKQREETEDLDAPIRPQPGENEGGEGTSDVLSKKEKTNGETDRAPQQKKKRRLPILLAIIGILASAAAALYFFLPRHGEWSEWSDKKPAEVKGRKIETVQGYRSRDLEEKTTNKKEDVVGEVKEEHKEYSDWSNWSDWIEKTGDQYVLTGATAKALAEKLGEKAALSSDGSLTLKKDDVVETAEEVRYRSREKKKTTSYTDWSSWSGWNTAAATKSETLDVESRTVYQYPAHGYACTTCGKVFDEINVTVITHMTNHGYGEQVKEIANVIVGNTTGSERDAVLGKYVSYVNTTLISESSNAYPEGRSPEGYVVGSPTPVTQYRTRSRTQKEDVSYSAWSSWSTKAKTQSDTIEVETQTVWRYRTRTLETIYTYEDWSDWSEWTTEEEKGSAEHEVESGTIYRYRDRI